MDRKQTMKMFVWQSVDGVTENHFYRAGVMVVAETLEEARALIPQPYGDGYTPGKPDAVYELNGDLGRRVFVFPDMSCC